MQMNNLGRDNLNEWTLDTWKQIDRTVHDMAMESTVAQKLLSIAPL